MTLTNPFIERTRIISPEHFAGRWAELSLIFERLEASQAMLISGAPGIGKSSLLTHIVQSAAINLEEPELRAFYLDLAGATGAAVVYHTIVEALGGRGDTPAALEVALVEVSAPALLCLDNAQAPLAAGWGEMLLEVLARVARGGSLLLVAAVVGRAPLLSERFATIGLGALAPTEVRLLVDAYLDNQGISFTPAELREIVHLSAGHPAYVQRAAYHVFQSKLDPRLDWRASYLAEARERPVPGAPLPSSVFDGRGQGRLTRLPPMARTNTAARPARRRCCRYPRPHQSSHSPCRCSARTALSLSPAACLLALLTRRRVHRRAALDAARAFMA